MDDNITISEARLTLGSLLRRPYEALQVRVYSGLKARGFPDIRPAHSSVFRYIRPKGSHVSDLAARADMAKQSMAYLVKDLTDLGYLDIIPDPHDGRAKLVVLTQKGQAVWTALVDLSAEAEAICADLIGETRVAALRGALVELADALASNAGQP